MKKEKSDQNAVAELTREGLYKENKWLWEENKKLNKKIMELQIEIGGLMGERDGLKMVVERLHKELEEQEAEGGGLFDEIDYRKRECKNLKEKVRFLEECLDRKEKVNKKLREENEKLRIDRELDKGNTIFGM